MLIEAIFNGHNIKFQETSISRGQEGFFNGMEIMVH